MVDPIPAWIWIQVIPIPALLGLIPDPDPLKSVIITPHYEILVRFCFCIENAVTTGYRPNLYVECRTYWL